jgi:hypothetical protein
MGRAARWINTLTGRAAMRSTGAASHRRETERRFWEQIATRITSGKAAEAVGVSQADDVALSERAVTSSNYKTSLASATAATSLRK